MKPDTNTDITVSNENRTNKAENPVAGKHTP
jgi:hypothetical protein